MNHHHGGPDRYCIRKNRYGRQAARRVARILNQQQLELVHAYPCDHCHRFHVGHR